MAGQSKRSFASLIQASTPRENTAPAYDPYAQKYGSDRAAVLRKYGFIPEADSAMSSDFYMPYVEELGMERVSVLRKHGFLMSPEDADELKTWSERFDGYSSKLEELNTYLNSEDWQTAEDSAPYQTVVSNYLNELQDGLSSMRSDSLVRGQAQDYIDYFRGLASALGEKQAFYSQFKDADQYQAWRAAGPRADVGNYDSFSDRGRLANMVDAAASGVAAGHIGGMRAMYEAGQSGRDRGNQELLAQWERDLERAQQNMEEYLEAANGDTTDRDVVSQQYIIDDLQRKIDAMRTVVEGNIQQQATEATAQLTQGLEARSQYATAEAKEGLGKIGSFATDTAINMMQMGGDAAVGLMTGGNRLVPMAFRVFGQSASEAKQAGADLAKQLGYGAASAGIEVFTEGLFDGLAGFYGDGAADEMVAKFIRKVAKTSAGRAAARALFSMGEEGLEEFISDLLTPAAMTIYTGKSLQESYGENLDWADVAYDFLIGAAASGGMNVVSAANPVPGRNAIARSRAENAQLAQVDEVERAYQQQGVTGKEADRLAWATQKILAGEDLTHRERKAYEASPIAQQVTEQLRNKQSSAVQAASMDTGKGLEDTIKQLFRERDIDLSNSEASILADGYVPAGMEPQTYIFGILDAYGLGRRGLTLEQAIQASGEEGAQLHPTQFRHAWQLGAGLTNSEAQTVDVNTEEGRKALSSALASLGEHTEAAANAYEASQDLGTYAAAMNKAASLYAASGADLRAIVQDARRGKTSDIVGMLTDAQVETAMQIGQQMQAQTQDMVRQLDEQYGKLREQAAAITAEGAQAVSGLDAAIKEANKTGKQAMDAFKATLASLEAMVEADPAAANSEEYNRAYDEALEHRNTVEEMQRLIQDLEQKKKELEGRKPIQRKKGTVSLDGGNIDGNQYEGINRENLSRQQKHVVAMVQRLADLINIDYVFFDGPALTGGAYARGGTVYININSGMGGELNKSIAAASLSHELTHFMQDYAPKEYEALKSYVISSVLNRSPAEFDRLVKQQMRWEPGKTYSEIVDELVANACQTMLLNDQAVTRMARENMTLAEKVADVLDDITGKIRAAFEEIDFAKDKGPFDAVRAVMGEMDGIAERWGSGIAAAVENYNAEQTVQQTEGEANTASEGGVQYQKFDDGETRSIKEQIQAHATELNSKPVVATVRVTDMPKNDIKKQRKWVENRLKSTGYAVDRKGLGHIEFTPRQINTGLNYLDEPGEVAAFAALPSVLKRGEIIDRHDKHKDRPRGSITIAAPVSINGVRGNMAVALTQTSKTHYHTHRIVMPDGSTFIFENENAEAKPAEDQPERTNVSRPSLRRSDAAPTPAGELPASQALIAEPISSTPKDSIAETADTVKGRDSTIKKEALHHPAGVRASSFTSETEGARTSSENSIADSTEKGKTQNQKWDSSVEGFQEYDVIAAVYDALDHADGGDDNLIKVGRMPRSVRELAELDGDLYLFRNHTYENIRTEGEAKREGRYSKNAHYHGVGEQDFIDAVMSIENPALTIDDSDGKGNPQLVMVLPVTGRSGTPLVAVIGLYENQPVIGKFDFRPHITLSIYEKLDTATNARGQAYSSLAEFVDQAAAQGRILSYNKEISDSLPVIAQRSRLGNITEPSLKKSVARFRQEVKTFRENNKINYQKWDDFSYDGLTSRPPMHIATVSDSVETRARADVINTGLLNAAKYGGKISSSAAYVHVEETGENIRITRNGLRHGLDRRMGSNGPVTEKIGEVLSNSIRLNELTPEDIERTESTYVRIGAARNQAGDLYVVEFVINKTTQELEEYRVLHSMNAKKEPAALLPVGGQKMSAPLTDSDISIADLLTYVNQYFPDVLPEDVLKHFGHKNRPEGKLGDSALYQRWDDTTDDTAAERDGRELAYARLQSENAILTETVDALRKLTDKQNNTIEKLQQRLQITKTPEVRQSDARKLARSLLNEHSSRADQDQIAAQLKALGDYILQTPAAEISEETLKNRARSIATNIIENSYEDINIEGEVYQRIAADLRGKKVSIDESFLGELDQDGGYEAFRKRYFGSLIFAKRAANTREARSGYVTADQLYIDMQGEYGKSYFPDVSNEGEQVQILARMFDAAKPIEVNPFDQYMGEATEDLANRIVMDAMSGVLRQTEPTTADKQRARTQALRDQILQLKNEKKLGDREAARLYQTIYDLSVSLDRAESKYETLRQAAMYREKRVRAEGSVRALEIRARERARAEEQIQALKAHYRQIERNARQRRENTGVRRKIRNLIDDLNRRLAKPTEKRHVPMELVRLTVDVLDMIDFDSGRGGENFAQKIQEIRTMYDGYREDSKYAAVYDDVAAEMLRDLSVKIGQTRLYEMNDTQLKATYDTLKSLTHIIDEAVMVRIGNEERNAFEVAGEMTRETREIPKAQKGWLKQHFIPAHLRPDVAFRRFAGFKKNSAWESVCRMLNDGQLKQTDITMKLSLPFAELINNEEAMRDLTGLNYLGLVDKSKLIDIGLKDETGQAIPVTHGIAAGIYMDLLNEDNRRHFIRGGKTIPNLNDYYRGKGGFGIGTTRAVGIATDLSDLYREQREAKANGDTAQVDDIQSRIDKLELAGESYADMVRRNIERQLTDFDRRWIEITQWLMDTESKRYLNETTLEVYGIEKANVENYYPITSDPNFLANDFESITRNMNLENAGFMKERVKSGNPSLALDISTVVNHQIQRVAQYSGLMPAIRNFNKIWNKMGFGYSDSLKNAVNAVFDKQGGQYIENLIADLTGSRGVGDDSLGFNRLMGKLRGNLAQTSLTMNPRVAFGQAASYPTAAAELGAKALTKAFFRGGRSGRMISRADTELIAKYSPLLYYRMQGYSTVELGDIKNSQRLSSRIWKKARWATGWIKAVDGATVGRLWYAAEYWVQDNMPHLTKGTDAYYQQVAIKFNDVVEKTQPNYTTMQRPQVLRDPNELLRCLTMFMTQRMQNFNVIYDAAGTYQKARADKANGRNGVTQADVSEAKAQLVTAVASQLTQAAVLVGFRSFGDILLHSVKAYRDDDDGELTLESVSMRLLDNYINALASMFLGGSELHSIISAATGHSPWYGISLGGVDSINDLINDFVSLASTQYDFENEKSKAKFKKRIFKLSLSFCQIFGIAANNAIKIGNALLYHIEDIRNGKFLSFEAGFEPTSKQQKTREIEAVGFTREEYEQIMREADKDGNGRLKQDELYSCIQSHKLTDKQIEYLWNSQKWSTSYADYDAKQRGSTKEKSPTLPKNKPEEPGVISTYEQYKSAVPLYKLDQKIAAYDVWENILQPSGMSLDRFTKILTRADTDSNGSLKQDELGDVLRGAVRGGEMTEEQAAAVWDSQGWAHDYAWWVAKH